MHCIDPREPPASDDMMRVGMLSAKISTTSTDMAYCYLNIACLVAEESSDVSEYLEVRI